MNEDIKTMLEQQPDFIAIKRYNNSLSALEKRYPEGIPSHIIAQALDTTEEDVNLRFQEIISRLRSKMGV